MNQDTYVPGMNGGAAQQPSYPSAPQAPQSPYQGGSTMVAGMGAVPQAPRAPHADETNDRSNTPVVGFLYSISKNGFPEFWPLYVGVNKIGKGAGMDIRLGEASVSDHHANINIKKMRTSGGRLVASIIDAGSKNGVILNDEELDYDPHSLKNEDIITIGCNYKLVLLLVDPVNYNLEVAPDFVEVAVEEPQTPFFGRNADNSATVVPGMRPVGMPTPPPSPYNSVRIEDETVNMNGGASGLNAGGTKIM